MDLPGIDWGTFATFVGGAATTLLSRGLGIHARLVALERSRDVQAELIANLTSELAMSRERLARTDAELQRVTRLLMTERREKRALEVRVTELEAALKAEKELRVRLQFSYAESLAQTEPSHRTLPPPGAKPR